MKNKAVFLDRDGVIIEDTPDYLHKPTDIKLITRSAEAIALLNKSCPKYRVIIISNQSGVGRGYFTSADLSTFSKALRDELKTRGAHIDAEYYCIHHPYDNCDCRKPKIGMFAQAEQELDIDLSQSFMIGDRNIDIRAGKNAGCKTIRVKTGYGMTQSYITCNAITEDLYEAVTLILQKTYTSLFDTSRLKVKPLSQRHHDLQLSTIQPINPNTPTDPRFTEIANQIHHAKQNCASVILMIGGHVVRSGTQRYIIDLMKKGFITHIAMNGAVMIHDYEFALMGATTESVAKYIKTGEFGLWEETGRINDYIYDGYKRDEGMGESVGKAILEDDFPHNDISLLATAYSLKIPSTVHVGIGYDIIHEHPNCNGAATGATSYTDFLYLAESIRNLENGVVMNFGSAVMAPEVFLKSLSMARNVNPDIKHFSTLVCDLHDLPTDFTKELDKSDPLYYFRPWKTMLVRTVSDGGKSFYIKGDHKDTIPALWKAVTNK